MSRENKEFTLATWKKIEPGHVTRLPNTATHRVGTALTTLWPSFFPLTSTVTHECWILPLTWYQHSQAIYSSWLARAHERVKEAEVDVLGYWDSEKWDIWYVFSHSAWPVVRLWPSLLAQELPSYSAAPLSRFAKDVASDYGKPLVGTALSRSQWAHFSSRWPTHLRQSAPYGFECSYLKQAKSRYWHDTVRGTAEPYSMARMSYIRFIGRGFPLHYRVVLF